MSDKHTEGPFSGLCDDGSRADRKVRNPHSAGSRDKYKSDRGEGVSGRAQHGQFFAADAQKTSTWDIAGSSSNMLHGLGKTGKEGARKAGQSQNVPIVAQSNTRDLVLTDNVEEIERRMQAEAPKAPANYQLDDVFDVAYREMQHTNKATVPPPKPAPQTQIPDDEFDF